MLTYNTQERELPLPEYGRNIQRMVDYCLTLDDRGERTACAYAIVDAMSTLFPAAKSEGDEGVRKYWDHLAVMAGYHLDIDWPFDVPQAAVEDAPEPVPYDTGHISLRQYGRNLESMVEFIATMDAGEERDAMLAMISNQMKKNLLADSDDDDCEAKICHDLYELSKGRLNIQPGELTLHEYNVVAPVTKKRKKK